MVRSLLDRRLLDPFSRHPDIEVEVEPATRAEALISPGEGPRTEFKQELPTEGPGSVMKTIAAFANGEGGTVLFGVDDDGTAIGLEAHDVRAQVDRIATLISDWVRPAASFTPELTDVNGAIVLLVTVAAGMEPLAGDDVAPFPSGGHVLGTLAGDCPSALSRSTLLASCGLIRPWTALLADARTAEQIAGPDGWLAVFLAGGPAPVTRRGTSP